MNNKRKSRSDILEFNILIYISSNSHPPKVSKFNLEFHLRLNCDVLSPGNFTPKSNSTIFELNFCQKLKICQATIFFIMAFQTLLGSPINLS